MDRENNNQNKDSSPYKKNNYNYNQQRGSQQNNQGRNNTNSQYNQEQQQRQFNYNSEYQTNTNQQIADLHRDVQQELPSRNIQQTSFQYVKKDSQSRETQQSSNAIQNVVDSYPQNNQRGAYMDNNVVNNNNRLSQNNIKSSNNYQSNNNNQRIEERGNDNYFPTNSNRNSDNTKNTNSNSNNVYNSNRNTNNPNNSQRTSTNQYTSSRNSNNLNNNQGDNNYGNNSSRNSNQGNNNQRSNNNNYHQPSRNNNNNNNNQNNYNNKQNNQNLPHQTNINQIGGSKKGKFIVDEKGDQFIQEEINGTLIKERIYIYQDRANRAIHNSDVTFNLIKQVLPKNANNKNAPKPKAEIISVEKYPEDLNSIIGFIGPKQAKATRPLIDFNIQKIDIDYQNQRQFYFYPLEIEYPRMIIELDNTEQLYPNGELFKKYFTVKFLEWPQELANDGPICQIISAQGNLYDEQSDCQALLSTLNINTTVSEDEKKCIKDVIKIYKKQLIQKQAYKDLSKLKVFTVDQIGTQAFDDALSFEKISESTFQNEIQLALKAQEANKLNQNQKKETKINALDKEKDQSEKKGRDKKGNKNKQKGKKVIYLKKDEKNSKIYEEEEEHKVSNNEENDNDSEKDSDQNSNQDEEEDIEEEKEEEIEEEKETDDLLEQFDYLEINDETKRNLYRIGIHISDLSKCIKEGSSLYKGLERRGQSIYLQLGKRQSFVKHMLDKQLVELFSLNKGKLSLSKSIFLCLEIAQDGQFVFHWDTLRIQNTKIVVKENYYYDEFDLLYKNIDLEKINSLYQQDNTDLDAEEDDEEIQNSTKQPVLSKQEYQALLLFGGSLLQQREENGQRAFQDDMDGHQQSQSYLSSKMVEEVMILYNQCISRLLVVKQHIQKGQKELEKKLKLATDKSNQNIKQIKKDKLLIEAKIKKSEKLCKQEASKITSIQKTIKKSTTSINDNDKVLLKYNTKIQQSKASLIKLNEQYENLLRIEEKSIDSSSNYNDQSQETAVSQTMEDEDDSESQENNINQQEEQELDDEEEEQEDDQSVRRTQQGQNLINQSESQSESSDAFYMEDIQNINPYTLQKNFQIKQMDDNTKLIKKLQEESTQQMNPQLLEDNKKEKQSYLKQVEYYKNQCLEVKFNNLNYETLEDFQNSIRSLKQNTTIQPIIKKYLMFKKNKILRDLEKYFAVNEKEKKQIKEHENKIKKNKDQLLHLQQENEDLNSKINNLIIQETEFNLKKILQQQQYESEEDFDVEESTEIIEEHQEQEIVKIDIKPKQKLTKREIQINSIKKQIQKLEKDIVSNEKLILTNGQKMSKLNLEIEKQKTQLEKMNASILKSKEDTKNLKEQLIIFQNQIDQMNIDLENLEKELTNNLLNEANDLHGHLEIIPESQKYVSVTSPIRKFNDIIVQQFLNQFIFAQSTIAFQGEYEKLLKHKQKNTQSRNQIRKFQEKAEKLKTCRRMLIKQMQQDRIFEKYEQVLQIKKVYFKNSYKMEFFLPDEMELVKFVTRDNPTPFPADFTIWEGCVTAKLCLPYDFQLVGVGEFKNQNFIPKLRQD